MMKLLRYWSAINVLIEGIEKAKEDGKISVDEVVQIFVDVLATANLSNITVYSTEDKDK